MGDDTWIGGRGGDGCPAGPERGEFVVVVADPVTGEVDAFGPYAAPVAASEVDRRRHELAMEGLDDVLVVVVALSRPE